MHSESSSYFISKVTLLVTVKSRTHIFILLWSFHTAKVNPWHIIYFKEYFITQHNGLIGNYMANVHFQNTLRKLMPLLEEKAFTAV